MARYMNFSDIRQQQFQVAQQTNEEMPGLFEIIDLGLSAIIGILYETSKDFDVNTDSGKVQSAAWLWIYKSVFTMSASLQNAEFGFYSESLSLNRSVTETLVQIIYLRRLPNEIKKLPSLSSGKNAS